MEYENISAENYIGIDPGINGAVAIWNGQSMMSFPLKKSMVEPIRVLNASSSICCIENVNHYPGMGARSAKTSLVNYGKIIGALESSGFILGESFFIVTAKEWQGYFGCQRRKPKGKSSKEKSLIYKEHKNDLLSLARRTFPHANISLVNADAALIAEYCRRTKHFK